VEQNRCCFTRFRQHTKPKAPVGLAYINVPNKEGKPLPILDQQEMEDAPLEFSQTHFEKAERSPFTIEPLNCLLAYDGLTPYGDKVTAGRPTIQHHHFDEPTKAILENLQQKFPSDRPLSHPLDYEGLMEGIKMA